MIIVDNRRPLKLQSASRVTGAVLTIRIDDYKIFVLTKVTSNHTNRRPSHSKCLSRLLSPLQIQLKSNRTGAVLTITINIYKTVVLTKVTSNHTNRRSNHFKCSSGLIFHLSSSDPTEEQDKFSLDLQYWQIKVAHFFRAVF